MLFVALGAAAEHPGQPGSTDSSPDSSPWPSSSDAPDVSSTVVSPPTNLSQEDMHILAYPDEHLCLTEPAPSIISAGMPGFDELRCYGPAACYQCADDSDSTGSQTQTL